MIVQNAGAADGKTARRRLIIFFGFDGGSRGDALDIIKAKVFLHAVDSGSLANAAAQFDYTPSAISHMMMALESEVGFPLLIRTKNGVTPTRNAERLIPILRAQCSFEEQFRQMVSEIHGLSSGELRIASYASIACQWLPSVISRFHADYPGIRIEIMEGVWQDLDSYLRENRADLAFFSHQPSLPYHWIFLKKDPMVVAVSCSHPLASRSSISLRELEKETLIMPAYGADLDVEILLRSRDLKIHSTISTIQNYSAMGLVEQGLGVLIMNELITKGRLNHLCLLPLDPPQYIKLGIAVSDLNRSSPAAQRFISYAKEIIPKL